jgi:hypothetical protein
MNAGGGQQRPISHPKLRPRNLPTQDRQLVPQHQQLNVFHVQAAPATNKRAQQSPNGEVEKGEGHAVDPPNPPYLPVRHRYWRPSRRAREGHYRREPRPRQPDRVATSSLVAMTTCWPRCLPATTRRADLRSSRFPLAGYVALRRAA